MAVLLYIGEKMEAKMSAERIASELTVAILPLGKISDRQIKLTAVVLNWMFGVKTIVLPTAEITSQYFNTERGRYQGDKILNFLFLQLPANAQRIMGILEGDLEENSNKPCLGLADLYQRVALYSVPHLSGQSDQSKKQTDQDLMSILLITHEFAHTLGLSHCDQLGCVMNLSQHGATMCIYCSRWADRELKVRPGSAEERFSFAESLFFNGFFLQAITVYRQAIFHAPKEPLYYHCLAVALNQAGQFDKAKKEMTRALALSGNLPDGYYNLGLVYIGGQRLEQAEVYFNKAIATAKDPRTMQRWIGQAYREILHDVERASRHYLQYLRLGGDDPDVVEWLISRSKLDKP